MSFVEFVEFLSAQKIPSLLIEPMPNEQTEQGGTPLDDLGEQMVDVLTKDVLGGKYDNTVYFALRGPKYNGNIMVWILSEVAEKDCVFWRAFCTPPGSPFACRIEKDGKPRESTFQDLQESVLKRVTEEAFVGVEIALGYPLQIALHLDWPNDKE